MEMKIAEGRKNETSRRDELDAIVGFAGKEGTRKCSRCTLKVGNMAGCVDG
jgi:hypothetical protein